MDPLTRSLNMVEVLDLRSMNPLHDMTRNGVVIALRLLGKLWLSRSLVSGAVQVVG